MSHLSQGAGDYNPFPSRLLSYQACVEAVECYGGGSRFLGENSIGLVDL